MPWRWLRAAEYRAKCGTGFPPMPPWCPRNRQPLWIPEPLHSTRSQLRLTESRLQLPIVPAADERLPVVGSAVIGQETLSATEHEPYGVGMERKVSIAIISGGKTATGADRLHRNGLIRYFHHSTKQIPGVTEIN
jgi:hypothetical protein